jgi:hypothetical protein
MGFTGYIALFFVAGLAFLLVGLFRKKRGRTRAVLIISGSVLLVVSLAEIGRAHV